MRNAVLTLAILVAIGSSALAQPAAPTPSADEPQGYTYKADGRRDPFVTLLRRGSDSQRTPVEGPRAGGLSGLMVDEITVKGTLASQGGFVGIVQGADNRTYIVHTGDRLLDGRIQTISVTGMVIEQQVNDPLSKQKVRDVRKVLRQTEEAR
jgi:Tfp pilus assembly protein PilP